MPENDDHVPLPETPEWKTARLIRGKTPRGPHIRHTPNPEAGEYSRGELFEALAEFERRKDEEKPMVISGIKFDRTISLGAVVGIIMTVASWGAAWGAFTKWQGTIENGIAANKAAIDDNRKGDEDRSRKYVPQIEAMQRAVDASDSRFNNVSSALNQLRDIVGDITKTMGQNNTDTAKMIAQTHEEIMVLRAKLGYDKRTELQPAGPQPR